MNYKQLFICIEGNDDERFFDRIIKPEFEKKYSWVNLWKYQEKKTEKIEKFIKSVKAMNASYIYVADIDEAPCVTAKKQEIQNKLQNVDEDSIAVVIKEIESWYLAGLNDTEAKKFRLPSFSTTDNITKEKFDALRPKKFRLKTDFMSEILKRFSIEIAKQKNNSFKYFLEKYGRKV